MVSKLHLVPMMAPTTVLERRKDVKHLPSTSHKYSTAQFHTLVSMYKFKSMYLLICHCELEFKNTCIIKDYCVLLPQNSFVDMLIGWVRTSNVFKPFRFFAFKLSSYTRFLIG